MNKNTRQNQNRFRIGIAGCGEALHLHLPAILQDKRVSLQALCDRNEDTANQYSRKLKCRAYNACSSFLRKEKLDVVHLLTPPHTHSEIGTAILRAGCHLLLEKPMAMNLKEAETLKLEAEKNGCVLTIVHNHLFDPPLLRAKRFIQGNKAGKLLHCQVIYCLNRKATKPKTTMSDHWVNHLPLKVFDEWLPHTVYVSREFLGSLRVDFASLHNAAERQWLTVHVSGEKGSGEIVVMDNTNYELFHINLYTENALLHLNMVDSGLRIMTKRSLPGVGPYMTSTLMEALFNMKSIADNMVDIARGKLKRKQPHINIIKMFYDHISGEGENPVTPEDGIDVTRTIDDIKCNLRLIKSYHTESL